jgi:phospholipid/cholesterol/gamma-HCH transport system substrate-binding protein
MTTANRIRLGIFAVFAMGAVILAGTKYVGIPERYLGQSYEISVNLPESGGIFVNAEVTLRGVPVGRVRELELTPDGVRADLLLENDTRIPGDTLVRVRNLSAMGEQYIELLPPDDEGPYLAEGESLPVTAASTPLEVTALLVHLDQLATSIGKDQLRRVVREMGKAFDNSGQDLATVLVRAQELSREFAAVQPETDQLLRDARTVLSTQADLDPELQALSRGLERLTRTLADNDPELAVILQQGPTTLDAVGKLLAQNEASVSLLLGNLISVGEIVAQPIRLRGLNTVLVLLPRVVQGTFNIAPGDGYARLGLVFDTAQAVCTRGYESSGTPPTQPAELSDVPGNPGLRANVNAFCAEPASSGIGVRGAAHAPRPPGDTTAQVIPQTNPRGFGPGSSFENDPGAYQNEETDSSPSAGFTASPAYIEMVGPTDLRGLLLKEELK